MSFCLMQIEAERQRLSLKRTSVENAIQQKLIEQRASALSAKAKGVSSLGCQ